MGGITLHCVEFMAFFRGKRAATGNFPMAKNIVAFSRGKEGNHWKFPQGKKRSWRFSGGKRAATGNFPHGKKTSWRPMEKHRGAFSGKASSHRVELPSLPLACMGNRLFLIPQRARWWLVGSYQLDLKVV